MNLAEVTQALRRACLDPARQGAGGEVNDWTHYAKIAYEQDRAYREQVAKQEFQTQYISIAAQIITAKMGADIAVLFGLALK